MYNVVTALSYFIEEREPSYAVASQSFIVDCEAHQVIEKFQLCGVGHVSRHERADRIGPFCYLPNAFFEVSFQVIPRDRDHTNEPELLIGKPK